MKELKSLTNLDLSFNKITKIDGLSELKSLTILFLPYNKITKIEGLSELRNLSWNLTNLYLTNNEITKIPYEIVNKYDILYENGFTYGINLYGNPLEEQLITAIRQGQEAVLAYYENLNKGSVFLEKQAHDFR
ncbi:MAG: leucine-rich repeat domain-containing protein [Saprospiraceae bacterium]|nr:leucine-rich repeat domain-containing protein [Saprospiraceae bacterium]